MISTGEQIPPPFQRDGKGTVLPRSLRGRGWDKALPQSSTPWGAHQWGFMASGLHGVLFLLQGVGSARCSPLEDLGVEAEGSVPPLPLQGASK